MELYSISLSKTILIEVLDWLGSETPKKCTCSFSHESVRVVQPKIVINVANHSWRHRRNDHVRQLRLWDGCSSTIFYNFVSNLVPVWQFWLVSKQRSKLQPFWSPWRVEKIFGDQKSGESRVMATILQLKVTKKRLWKSELGALVNPARTLICSHYCTGVDFNWMSIVIRQLGFCPGVLVYKGITIALSLFRSHWLAVVCIVWSFVWALVNQYTTIEAQLVWFWFTMVWVV